MGSTLLGAHLLTGQMSLLLGASGLGVILLVAAGWRIRAAKLRRRSRRPLECIISEAILAGSAFDPVAQARVGSTMQGSTANSVKLALSRLEKLNDETDVWGFSVHDDEKLVFTLAYPDREKARTAHEAMRHAFNDLAWVLQPVKISPVQPDDRNVDYVKMSCDWAPVRDRRR